MIYVNSCLSGSLVGKWLLVCWDNGRHGRYLSGCHGSTAKLTPCCCLVYTIREALSINRKCLSGAWWRRAVWFHICADNVRWWAYHTYMKFSVSCLLQITFTFYSEEYIMKNIIAAYIMLCMYTTQPKVRLLIGPENKVHILHHGLVKLFGLDSGRKWFWWNTEKVNETWIVLQVSVDLFGYLNHKPYKTITFPKS